MDPHTVIFLPGGTIFGVILFSGPLAALAFSWWRRRARARIAKACCGNCGQRFDFAQQQYLVAGIEICEPCASTMKRALRVVLPTIAVSAVVFAITSGTAFAIAITSRLSSLDWWLDGRWIPLLTPSVGVASLTWLLIKLGKRANRAAEATPQLSRHVAELLPFPSAVISDARQRQRVEHDDVR
jgi:hypothetical protein